MTNERRFMVKAALALILPLLLSSCMLGPDYQRPEVPEPAAFRGEEGKAQAESIADANWSTVANDPVLDELIREAIANNLDLRTAAARVTEARARYGVVRSFQFPEVGVTGGYSSQQDSQLVDPPEGRGPDSSYSNWDAGIQVSWELDLFGRIRRESEAAFAAYLATEQGQRAVLVALVGDVASNYLLMRQFDQQLEIARQTVVINEETVRFYQNRLQGGLSNRLELDTAIANLARTKNLVPQFERDIASTENALSLLLGRPPGPDRARRTRDGSAAARDHPGGPACRVAREAAGCAGGGTTARGCQRAGGRCKGPVLPANITDRPVWQREWRFFRFDEQRCRGLGCKPEPVRAGIPGRQDHPQL